MILSGAKTGVRSRYQYVFLCPVVTPSTTPSPTIGKTTGETWPGDNTACSLSLKGDLFTQITKIIRWPAGQRPSYVVFPKIGIWAKIVILRIFMDFRAPTLKSIYFAYGRLKFQFFHEILNKRMRRQENHMRRPQIDKN